MSEKWFLPPLIVPATFDCLPPLIVPQGLIYAGLFAFQGVLTMKESVTYQAIIEEGEAKGEAKGKTAEARNMIFLQGRSKFGEPSAEAEAALNALSDVSQLEELGGPVAASRQLGRAARLERPWPAQPRSKEKGIALQGKMQKWCRLILR